MSRINWVSVVFNSSSFHCVTGVPVAGPVMQRSESPECVELSPIIHIRRGKPSFQTESWRFLTFGAPKEIDGLLSPHPFPFQSQFPKVGFSVSTHCCLASVLKLLKGTWVAENKALISSRKLVQQKPRHCQQPSGVLPIRAIQREVLCGYKYHCFVSNFFLPSAWLQKMLE